MKTFLAIVGLYLIIGLLWVGAEWFLYGERRPSVLHDFIAIALAIAIYYLVFD